MIKSLISITCAIVILFSFSLNTFAATPVKSAQKKVTQADNDTANIDNKQELSKDDVEQTEKKVKTRPRRRR